MTDEYKRGVMEAFRMASTITSNVRCHVPGCNCNHTDKAILREIIAVLGAMATGDTSHTELLGQTQADKAFEAVWSKARVMDESPKTVARFIWDTASKEPK